ncbi:MAG: betaine-aldehyde dehydrogenase [bacterium]|nr:betaine-aldehyde dehydrogenase [bacterium]
MSSPQQQYIHGRTLAAADPSRSFENFNPATGEILGQVEISAAADVDRAVESAREGFAVWSAMSGADRGRILLKAVAILRERNDELARLEVLDTGKPIAEALAVDVASGADCIEYFAGLAASLHGHHYDLPGAFAYTRREPLGICAGIGAWNYPLQIACWKSGPALACGNAMIYKASELTPMSAIKLAEIYTEAGVPPGVFNVVQGAAETGQLLSRHPQIAKVSFTGEVGTGKRVMADAALSNLKEVTMELGGKSPLIIFSDANLDSAVNAALLANFYTQGEICTNGTRVFVQDEIRPAFIERLVARTKELRVGDPMDPGTQIGSLINRDHQKKVLGFIEAGRAAGARVLCGGGVPVDEGGAPRFPDGCFVEPTIFDGCTDDMSIVREEIFGPVLSILGFPEGPAGEEEAVRRANDTPYGLAAGVYTRDINRAHRVVARLQAGTCWINTYNITPIEMPIGGYKESGLGRENSPAALDHYTQLKSVYVDLGDGPEF